MPTKIGRHFKTKCHDVIEISCGVEVMIGYLADRLYTNKSIRRKYDKLSMLKKCAGIHLTRESFDLASDVRFLN